MDETPKPWTKFLGSVSARPGQTPELAAWEHWLRSHGEEFPALLDGLTEHGKTMLWVVMADLAEGIDRPIDDPELN